MFLPKFQIHAGSFADFQNKKKGVRISGNLSRGYKSYEILILRP